MVLCEVVSCRDLSWRKVIITQGCMFSSCIFYQTAVWRRHSPSEGFTFTDDANGYI